VIPLCQNSRSGFTLVELLIALAIFAIIMTGIEQILSAAIAAYGSTGPKQLTQEAARFAMERMVLFVQESDSIVNPVSTIAEETLKVSERVLDTYNNATHAYAAGGDGLADGDNDSDGLVNEGGADPADQAAFYLDKTDGGNWKLMERLPNYGTADTADYSAPRVLCEHVALFSNRLLAADLVEINLTLSDAKSQVSLTTRARMR
jgi:prepilin-type N-terminal cleavage/methylation domain-containing protein